jgi:hypothetical protein
MKPFSRSFIRSSKTFAWVSLSLFVLFYFLMFDRATIVNLRKKINSRVASDNIVVAPIEKAYPLATNYQRKNWHDQKFIDYEKLREGPGEQGKPLNLTDPDDIEENDRLFKIEGLFVIVSDKISVNRSVPDTRHEK